MPGPWEGYLHPLRFPWVYVALSRNLDLESVGQIWLRRVHSPLASTLRAGMVCVRNVNINVYTYVIYAYICSYIMYMYMYIIYIELHMIMHCKMYIHVHYIHPAMHIHVRFGPTRSIKC